MDDSLLIAPPLAESPATLLDVRRVATLLGCSARHVYRLSETGRMPRPRLIGALVRWSRVEIEAWVANGCLPLRTAEKG